MENPEHGCVLGSSLEHHVLAVLRFALLPLVTLPTSIASHQSKTGTRLEKTRIRIWIYDVFCVNSSRREKVWPLSDSPNLPSALRVNRASKSFCKLCACASYGWRVPEHINIKKAHWYSFFPSRCVTPPTDANQSQDYFLRALPSFQSHWDFLMVRRDRTGFEK